MPLPPIDAFSDRYQNTDGSITAVLSAKPLRRWTAQGWQDLTGVLTASTTPGYALQAVGEVAVQLGGTSAQAPNTLSRHGRSISFALAGISPVPGLTQPASTAPGSEDANGRTVRFTEAYPGTDVTLTSIPGGGLKETIVVKGRQAAPWNGEFGYALSLDGLDARPLTDTAGSHILLSESGTGVASPVMQIAPPYAVDANGSRTDACWYLLADDRKSLTLVVDPNWLADPARAYPVTIDPTVTIQPDATDGQDTTVDYYWPDTNFGTQATMYLGYESSSSTSWAAYLRFNLTSISRAATVTSATLNVWVISMPSPQTTLATSVSAVGGPWDEATLTYHTALNLPAPTPIGSEVTLTYSGTSTLNSLPVTSAVTSWAAGLSRNSGFVLQRGASASTGGAQIGASEGSLPPALVVTYTAGNPSTTYNVLDAGAPRPWQAGTALNREQTVNLLNGNVLTTLPITGWQGFGPPIAFTLYHNSRQDPAVSAGLSPKWTHSYATSLSFVGSTQPKTTVYVRGPDGTRDTFTNVAGTNTYTRPTGVYNELVYSPTEINYQLTTPDQRVYRYSTAGILQSITDPNGQAVTLTYDGSYRLTTVQDANPTSGNRRSLTLGYDASSRISTITDPLGRVWTLVYDATTGDLVQVKLPRRTDGTTDSLEYGYRFGYVDHVITGIGEPNDNPTSNLSGTFNYSTEYDASGRGTASLGRSGLGVRGMHGIYINYADTSSSPTWAKVVDQTDVAHQVNFSSGILSSAVRVNNPTAADTSWTGPTTSYSFDSGRNLIGVRLPGNPATLGGNPFWTTSSTYNSTGDVLSQTTNVLTADQSALAQTRYTAFAYAHGHHRLTQSQVKVQDTPSVVYRVTDHFYDGDTTNTGTSGWKQWTKTQTYASNAPGTKRTVSLAYYPNTTYPGRVQTRTDANGQNWGYTYDNWGNPTQMSSPNSPSRTVQATYDPTAHLLPLTGTDNAGQVFTTTYHTTGTNPDRRPVSRAVNTTGTPTNSFHWCPDGALLYATNNISGGGAAQTVSRSFTDGGLITQEVQPNQTVNSIYDAMGRPIQQQYTVSVQYKNAAYTDTQSTRWNASGDGAGQVASQTWTPGYTGPAAQTLTYSYDSAGRLQEQATAANRTLFATDNLGEETLRSLTTADPNYPLITAVFTPRYRPDGWVDQLVRSRSLSAAADYTKTLTYDAWGEMTEEDHLDGGLSRVRRQTYGFDANGNRTARNEYNSANAAVDSETLSYDVGNRLSGMNHYNSSGSLVYTESFTSAFDGTGNQAWPSGSPTASSTYGLSYYPDNRLQTVSNVSPAYNETSCYDGRGRLCSRGTSLYGYAGQTPITEQVGSWTQAETMKGGAGDLQITYNPSSAPTLTWALYDSLGNVAQVTDTSGSVLDWYGADLYGTNAVKSGAADSGEFNWLGGLTYRNRATPKVFQVGARTYDPGMGRFLQQDPMGFGGGSYSYGAGNPANFVDPSGMDLSLDPVEACMTIAEGAGAVLGIGAGKDIAGAAGIR